MFRLARLHHALPGARCQQTTGTRGWVTAKPLEHILGANGLSPFDSGDRLEQFALFLGSGFEGLPPVLGCDDRDLGRVGALAPGAFADLIVIDRNVMAVPADELKDLKVLLTIIAGQVVSEQR